MNVPKKIGNAISKFSMKKEDLLPGIPDHVSGYDKIVVIQICLKGRSEEDAESELTGMLNVLFDSKLESERKIKRLEEQYHIEMESKLGKELNQMCNLSDWVEEIGIQKGMERGEVFTLIKLIQKKYRKKKSLQEIADELEEKEENIEKIYRYVKENPEKTETEILELLEEGSVKK